MFFNNDGGHRTVQFFSEDEGLTSFESFVSNVPSAFTIETVDHWSLKVLLGRVVQSIHTADNFMCNVMNGFLISLGSYVAALTSDALAAAAEIGPIHVDMNGTACKMPSAADCKKKTISKNVPPAKKKTVKC